MKLVTAACALVAASAFAVESANIVGYLEFTGTGSFNLTAATFLPVGTDGSTMTLGNIVGNDAFKVGTDYINLYTSTGDFITDATYANATEAGKYDVDPGWYSIDDWDGDAENNLNSTALPFGAGIAFCRTSAGAALKYVGELKQAANTLPAPGSFNLVGNTSPKDITLGDIVGNDAFRVGTDYINLYTSTGDFITDATYANATEAGKYDVDPGWYSIDDWDGDAENNLNSTPIPAGAGFAFCKTTSAARLIVANPME